MSKVCVDCGDEAIEGYKLCEVCKERHRTSILEDYSKYEEGLSGSGRNEARFRPVGATMSKERFRQSLAVRCLLPLYSNDILKLQAKGGGRVLVFHLEQRL